MTSPTPLKNILSVPVQCKKELWYESTPEEDIPTGLLIIDQKVGTDAVDFKLFIGHSNAKSWLKLLIKKSTQLPGCPEWFIIILLWKCSNWLCGAGVWRAQGTGEVCRNQTDHIHRAVMEDEDRLFTFGKSRQRRKWGININYGQTFVLRVLPFPPEHKPFLIQDPFLISLISLWGILNR